MKRAFFLPDRVRVTAFLQEPVLSLLKVDIVTVAPRFGCMRCRSYGRVLGRYRAELGR
jgi:hypothetical protein